MNSRRFRAVGWAAVALFLCMIETRALAQPTVEKHPKVVVLFDVSTSMNTIDGPANPGQDPAKLPSRQEQVLQFLAGKLAPALKGNKGEAPFLDQVLAKAPVTAYRFGATLDEADVAHFEVGKTWTAQQWARWLKADRGDGTNVPGAALQLLRREKDNYLQAILIFSDGRSNRATRAEFDAFLTAVEERKPAVPVFTIGVGEHQALPSIRVGELQAPQEVRPHDKFTVRVPVHGVGLAGAEFQVKLEAQRVADVAGKAVVREKRYLPGPRVGKFKLADAAAVVDFEVDLGELKKDTKNGELEGTWQFTARVPSHPREAFALNEHVSAPVHVAVQNRRLRVLLFADGPTREYQFLRSALYREVKENRLDMSIHLQKGKEDHIDQDVEPERFLADFPDRLGPNEAGKRFMSLNDYDVIVAFDPDFTKLSVKQRKLLNEWVGTHAGGIIFVAGPINTYQFSRPGGHDFSALLAIHPVVLKDSRLQGLGMPGEAHDATRPYALNFTSAAKQYPFLKLDDTGDTPTAGWKGFFWNNENFKPDLGKDERPRKGFFSYYPVERIKPASQVIATFAGPKESRIGDKTDAFKDQQPFLVGMFCGNGRSLYLGSGELWRLRGYKDGYHERLWFNMLRYVASGGVAPPTPFGHIRMSRSTVAGVIPIEAQLWSKDSQLLDKEHTPTVLVRRLSDDGAKQASSKLQAKDEAGWFKGTVKLDNPGDYIVRIAIPGSDVFLSHRLTVRKEDSEMDDVRVDFAKLLQLASKAEPVLLKLPADTRAKVEALLAKSAKFPDAPDADGIRWLFFRLSAADAIPACLEKLPPRKFAKVEAPKVAPPDAASELKSVFKEKKIVKVLIIDGDGARGRAEGGDSFFIERVIFSIADNTFKVTFGDELAKSKDAAKALERDDLATYGAVFLLNVRELTPKQLANLETYSKKGGGVAFFLGPLVNATYYNKSLYKAGKGVFPVPLEATYFPPANDKERADSHEDELLLRDDLYPDLDRYPIFGNIFENHRQRFPLQHFPVRRYFKVTRAEWRPEPGRSFELATLANAEDVLAYARRVAAITRGADLKHIMDNKEHQDSRPALERHVKNFEDLIRPGTEKKAAHLVKAIDGLILDASLKKLWRGSDPRVRAVLEDLVRLRHEARIGDPMVVGGQFGKGRVVAVLTSAGKEWTDFPGGSTSAVIYPVFIWETLAYLIQSDTSDKPVAKRIPANDQPPQLIGFDLAFPSRKLAGKNVPKELADAHVVTLNAVLDFQGRIVADAGIAKAHWVIDVQPVEIDPLDSKKFGKLLAAMPERQIPLETLRADQEHRAYVELQRKVLAGSKDKTCPSGFAATHLLADERGLDLGKHLAHLKAKVDEPQGYYLVKISLSATSASAKAGTRTSPPLLFLVASESELLVHVNRQNEKLVERLEIAIEKTRKIQGSLAEQTVKLTQPDADLKLVAVRVAEMRSTLRTAVNSIRESGQDYDGILRELQINRIKKDAIDRVDRIAGDLESLAAGVAPPCSAAEDSLQRLSELLEAGKKDGVLKQARDAQTKLAAMDKKLGQSVDQIVEITVEGRLTEFILQMEKEQLRKKPK